MNTPHVSRSACAKIILCGEHAVVYGRPAIALPLPQLRARASVTNLGERIEIIAPDIQARFFADDQPDHALAQVTQLTVNHVLSRITLASGAVFPPPFALEVRSDIPVSSHLGSGAAVNVACARAIAAHLGCELSAEEASAIAFEIEKTHHGTPSGIDNTVIAYEQPVWFVKEEDGRPEPGDGQALPATIRPLSPALSPPSSVVRRLVIGDTGISTPTKIPVGQVRAGWERDRARFERCFDEIGQLVVQARQALQTGDWALLGMTMNANHAALQWLAVSSPELDHLCNAARTAGALGAKLSGGGQGGNMIALARDEAHVGELRKALRRAGAVRVF